MLKSSKGKIDKEIMLPSFLSNPSHQVKFVLKHVFGIVNDGKSERCGCTKADSLRLNKDWGYTIKKNRNKILEEL